MTQATQNPVPPLRAGAMTRSSSPSVRQLRLHDLTRPSIRTTRLNEEVVRDISAKKDEPEDARKRLA